MHKKLNSFFCDCDTTPTYEVCLPIVFNGHNLVGYSSFESCCSVQGHNIMALERTVQLCSKQDMCPQSNGQRTIRHIVAVGVHRITHADNYSPTSLLSETFDGAITL